ncbi:MAG TPA: lysophospholipid acyltransferase family protein [Chitinispirillaceae bacterium]|nr:lysophospholipid acyltransferase family protein [Chitinispirillaceae bacterium]
MSQLNNNIEKESNTTPVRFSTRLAGTAIWALSSLTGFTWRIRLSGYPSLSPASPASSGRIFAFWHSHLLPLTFIFRNCHVNAIVSRSRDGVLAAYVAERWGHTIISGSSHRGGSMALRQSLRVLKENGSVAITPDGPRGPKEIVKAGAAQLAAVSGAPVIILSVHPHCAWRLNSWDRFIIPKPFSKLTVHVSEPVYAGNIPPSDDHAEDVRKAIQGRFDDVATMA